MEALRDGDPRYVGPYRVFGLLSVGGMGRVYLGESPGGRKVAVKVMRPELTTDPEFRARFKREVAAAREVGGYHTAQLIDADPDAEAPWLVTAYIPAPSLESKVKNAGPLGPGALRELAAALAEGLAAIHACGLVHRDLKPRNILMAEDGPRIIDFGVARPASTGTTPLTVAGNIVGTPSFMSPEQIDARAAGPASDIFSLGGVLVFAATGRSPFGDQGLVPVSYAILSKEPDLSLVPEPLRAIVRSCLAKDPAARPTPAALLATLASLPRDLPTGALPADVLPADVLPASAFPASALPAGALPAGAMAAGAMAIPPERAARPVRRPVPVWRPGAARLQRAAFPPARPGIQVRPASGGWSLVAADPSGRWLASADGDGTIAIWDAISSLPVRAWPARARVDALAAGPDRLLAVAGDDGMIRLWDVATGSPSISFPFYAERIEALAFDAAGSWLAAGEDGRVRVWDADGSPVAELTCGFRVTALAFDADAERLAVGGADGTIGVWDPDRDRAGPLAAGADTVTDWRGDSGVIVALGWDGATRRWVAVREDGPDGRLRAACVSAGMVSTVDEAKGEVRAARLGDATDAGAEGDARGFGDKCNGGEGLGLRGVALIRSEKSIVMGGADGVLHLWDGRAGQGRVRAAGGAGAAIGAIAVSADERRVAVCDERRRVTVYDVADGSLAGRWTRVSPDAVSALAFSPDGLRLVTAGDSVRRWDAADGGRGVPLPGGEAWRVRAVACEHQGRRLAAAGADGTVRVWDGSRLARTLTGHKGEVLAVAFGRGREERGGRGGSPGDALAGKLITAGYDGTIRIWDLSGGREPECVSQLGFRPRVLAAGPGTVAVGCADGTIRLCEPPDWTDAPVLEGHVHGITAMRFAGDRLVTGSRDGTARVWDLAARRTELLLAPDSGGWAAAELLADGTWRGHGDTKGRIWLAAGMGREPLT